MNGNRDGALYRLRRARSVASAAEAKALYASWAETYDDDVYTHAGVTGTATVAARFVTHAGSNRNISILDAGCGTGELGMLLHRSGFTHVDGIDISLEMIAVAKAKQVYRSFAVADLNAEFEAPSLAYDAIVSAGTFVHGHAGARGLHNLVRHLKPDGLIVCAVSQPVWQQESFDALIADLPLAVVSSSSEAVLPDGEADTRMLVARHT